MKTHIATRYLNQTFCGRNQSFNIIWSDSVKKVDKENGKKI